MRRFEISIFASVSLNVMLLEVSLHKIAAEISNIKTVLGPSTSQYFFNWSNVTDRGMKVQPDVDV